MKSWNCVGRVFLTVLAAASLVACGEGFVEDEEFDMLDQAQTVDEMSEEAFDEKIRGGQRARRAPRGMVALMKIAQRLPNGQVRLANTCGGTLISNRSVLTAEHCIDRAALRRGDYVICAGKVDTRKCARADFAFVDRAKFHPSEDAAILILDRPMKRKSKSLLASRAHDPKGTARTTAFGFGRMKGMKNGKNLPNSFSSNLRQVSLNTVPNQQCRNAWRGITHINGAKLCIKSSRKRGVCNGDSGGPVYHRGRQVGIASFVSATKRQGRVSTCTGAQPDVFVRVSAIRSWINRAIVR